MQTEQPLPIKIRLWLNHKIVLSYKTSYYKEPEIAVSLQMVQALVKMVRINCYGYNKAAICKMVLMYQKHLRNILPHPNNSSYAKSVLKLEEIITTAKFYLQNTSCKS